VCRDIFAVLLMSMELRRKYLDTCVEILSRVPRMCAPASGTGPSLAGLHRREKCVPGGPLKVYRSILAVRKYVVYARGCSFKLAYLNLTDYFGQPSGGFFFASDALIARLQSPLSFSVSAFGPGLVFGLAFFFLIIVKVHRLSHRPLRLRCPPMPTQIP